MVLVLHIALIQQTLNGENHNYLIAIVTLFDLDFPIKTLNHLSVGTYNYSEVNTEQHDMKLKSNYDTFRQKRGAPLRNAMTPNP